MLLGVLSLMSSCSVMLSMYGLKQPVNPSEAQIRKQYAHAANLYFADSSYFNWIEKVSGGDPIAMKYFIQPIQIYLFDEKGQLLRFSNNCSYPGFRTDFLIQCSASAFPCLNVLPDSIIQGINREEMIQVLNPLKVKDTFPNDSNLLVCVSEIMHGSSENLFKIISKSKWRNAYTVVNIDRFIYPYTEGKNSWSTGKK